jgi:hypothetical protein
MRWMPLPLAFSLAVAATAGLAADAPLRPEQMRPTMGLKVGAWRSVSTLVELEVEPGPGDDPAEAERAKAAMRDKMRKPMTQDQCLWDDRSGLRLPGLKIPGNCEFSRLEARDGRFAVAGICRHPDSAAVIDMTTEGTYTAEGVNYRSEATASAGKGQIRVKMDIASRFTGPCAASPPIRTPPFKGN